MFIPWSPCPRLHVPQVQSVAQSVGFPAEEPVLASPTATLQRGTNRLLDRHPGNISSSDSCRPVGEEEQRRLQWPPTDAPDVGDATAAAQTSGAEHICSQAPPLPIALDGEQEVNRPPSVAFYRKSEKCSGRFERLDVTLVFYRLDFNSLTVS